jgi:hypothetical protein
MNKAVVLMVPESNVQDVFNDLGDMLKEHNILIKIVDDYMFNTMFNIDCEQITVDMSDEVFHEIALMAHENDVTFNQQVVKILKEQVEKEKNNDIDK